MNEQITVHVTIQLECYAGQVVRGRPLGPWNVHAVGASSKEVCGELERRLGKVLRKSLPTHYFEGTLPTDHERWTTSIELKPPERSIAWNEPIQIELACFRWHLRSGFSVVRVPAVGCTLFGKPDELDRAEVNKQAGVALLRVAEDWDLLDLRERFSNREYNYQCLSIDIPLSLRQEQQDKGKDPRKRTSTLRATASDLTEADLQPIYGLDEKASDLAEYLTGESPQSVLLVGQAGVGKSSLVHRLVSMRQSLGLGERKIWTTSGARIVSGMCGLGMWQQRCARLMRQAHATNAIVHLGSLFELMEAGKIDGQPGVASMVRQAIGRRRLLAIAECTPEQLAAVERNDPMLLRAFVRMELSEPPQKQVFRILQESATDIYGKDTFSAPAIEELCRLHSRFATYSALPATALRLMRTMQDDSTVHKTLGADDVARAFARQTGLPRSLVDDSIKLDLQDVRSSLAANVIGQSEPVDLVVNMIATLKARLVRPGRPLATLMFIGPTGVGKTEMAKAIARLLYSDTRRMIRIDMSEYSAPWSAAKLIGKPGEGDGTLTSPIREQPFSVVLLDEFEKADSTVFDILLQLLGEGRLTDAQGRTADFRNAVVIMTSNLGAETFREANFGFSDGETASWREHFQREVRKFVRPEFLGRIDRIVPFQPLPRDIVRQIALRELDLLRSRTGLKYSESTLEFDSAAVDLLSQIGYQPQYGARPLRRAIEENVTVPLANALSRLSDDSTWHFKVGVSSGAIIIVPEKKSTKSESFKDKEADLINSWQQLGAMARAAMNSGPLRNLENELERNSRQNEVLRKKLKTASSPRRVAKWKEDLASGETAVETARRLRAKMDSVTSQITSKQLELMLRWHRNQEIVWDQHRAASKDLTSQLRQVTEDILKGRISEGNSTTLMVTGKGSAQLEVLWKAYHQLAATNNWSVDEYLVKPYDPLLDQDSPEYRKRTSERKADLTVDTESKPVLRLLAASGDENKAQAVKVCDLFRPRKTDDFGKSLATASGFALQIRGQGVVSWLEDEHGTVHFFDSDAVGPKRRIRLKVNVFEGRLMSIELASDWMEPVAAPQRDPRRTFSVASQEIIDSSGTTVSYAQGKQSAALAELIEKEHERALWHAIGYEGVPNAAQLYKEMEVPF